MLLSTMPLDNYKFNESGDITEKWVTVTARSKKTARAVAEEDEYKKRINSMTYPFFKVTGIEEPYPDSRSFGFGKSNQKTFKVHLVLEERT